MAASIELLRQADMVLNSCGRPVPPAGYRFVDLPRVLPYFQQLTTPPSPPFQGRLSNAADTRFLVRGVAVQTTLALRIRWPDGHFLSQNPSTVFNPIDSSYPMGLGGNMLAFPTERVLDPGARISIEASGSSPGTIKLAFWGVLRYLLKMSNGAPGSGPAACLVGYPSAPTGGGLATMPDPAAALAALPRIKCGPNQNIMAPEFRLGNQLTPETPDGYEDASFTFFSSPISVAVNGESYNNIVIVPGGDDVVIRNVTGFVSYTGTAAGIPTIQVRLPNGYSLTGGDLVPFNVIPAGAAVFPTMRIASGGRIIIDMANLNATGIGNIVTVVQFDGVKRRKGRAA